MAEKGSFWTSTAAILTAVGTLLAGVVALATFVVSQDWFGGSLPPGPEPSRVKISDDKHWGTAELRVDGYGFVDLDQQPPKKDDVYTGIDIYLRDSGEVSGDEVYLWEGDGTPSASDCATYTPPRSTTLPQAVDVGSHICLITTDGRVGLLTVKAIGRQWIVDVTIWKQRVRS